MWHNKTSSVISWIMLFLIASCQGTAPTTVDMPENDTSSLNHMETSTNYLNGPWTVLGYDREVQKMAVVGVLDIKGSSYEYVPHPLIQSNDRGAIIGDLFFLDKTAGAFICQQAAWEDLLTIMSSANNVVATCKFSAGGESSGNYVIRIGKKGELNFAEEDEPGQIRPWAIKKSFDLQMLDS